MYSQGPKQFSMSSSSNDYFGFQKKQTVEWIPDEKAPSCAKCRKDFGFFFRRHHCRICGQVFCKNCSRKTDLNVDGDIQLTRVCKKCNAMYEEFAAMQDKQSKNLIFAQQGPNPYRMTTNQNEADYIQSQDLYRTVSQLEMTEADKLGSSAKRSESINQNEAKIGNMLGVSDRNTRSTFGAYKSGSFMGTSPNDISDNFNRLARSHYEKREDRADMIKQMKSNILSVSTTRKSQMERYLNRTSNTLRGPNSSKAMDKYSTQVMEDQDRERSWLEAKVTEHISQVVKKIISEFKIDQDKWLKVMLNCTSHAVQMIKPSSQLLGDSIDFNTFIKIVTVNFHDQSLCRYVNGVVFKQEVANKKMRSDISNPRILLLTNSLGYVQDEEGFIDLEAEIKQEKDFISIIRNKIAQVTPDIVFIEKDASRNVIDALLQDGRTVVTNTSMKMLQMIARCTQTITCPSTNLLDKNFIVGQCSKFRVDKIDFQAMTESAINNSDANLYGFNSLTTSTSLMCLEGCQPKLGCSIVISGDDPEELKQVRYAFQKCLRIARMLILEREYLAFVKTDLNKYKPPNSTVKEISSHVQDTPFLLDKHMQRDFIVLEYFSLSIQPGEEAAAATITNQHNFEEIKQSDRTQLSEAEIRRKLLRNMCLRPVKKMVKFYQDNDLSIFTMIQQMAMNAYRLCPEPSCQKFCKDHRDYWYHGNGCIEIKYREDQGKSIEFIRSELLKPQTIFCYCYCNVCNEQVLSRTEAPNQMLEMSFYKLLEQFIYNQGISMSETMRKKLFVNDKFKPCGHSFHRDWTFLMRYGPIKVMINYEPLDPYTLDIIHFGNTPGVVNESQIQQQVNHNLFKLSNALAKSLNFLEEQSKLAEKWIQMSLDEVFVQNYQGMQDRINDFGLFMGQYITVLEDFKLVVTKNYLGNKLDPNFKEQVVVPDQFTTIGQVTRFWKVLGAKICEFTFILKRCLKLITVNLPNKFFKKNANIFLFTETTEVPEKPTKSYHAREEFGFLGMAGNDSFENFNSSSASLLSDMSHNKKRGSSKLQYSNEDVNNLHHAGLLKMNDMHPSEAIKTIFKDLQNFDVQLNQESSIKEMVEYTPFLPSGFNSNAIGIKSHDFSSYIASVIGSNLYLNGLTECEYLNMENQLKPLTPYTDEQDQEENHLRQSIPNRTGSKVVDATNILKIKDQCNKFILRTDVLNEDNVTINQVETELLQENNYIFWFAFSSSQPAEMQILKKNKPIEQFTDSPGKIKEFYCKDYAKVASLEDIEEFNLQEFYDNLANLQQALEKKNPQGTFKQSVIKLNERGANGESLQGSKRNIHDSQSKIVIEEVNDVKEASQSMITKEMAFNEIHHLYYEKLDFTVKMYFPTQFEALRRVYCGAYKKFVESIFCSSFWKDNTGGKTRSPFFKSFDNKFILKGVQKREINMFGDMATSYFEYLCRSFTQQNPSAIAKTLGIFKIKAKLASKYRTETFYFILMENLLLNVDESQVFKYDLKGSRRNRFIANPKAGQVTLDNNFLFDQKSRPLPMQHQMKYLLQVAINNDSFYLSKHAIIDYSLLVIINPHQKTIRVGIIDYIQQYTLDKTLESFYKQATSNEVPTIINPDDYKMRFRIAMDKYFVALIPDSNEDFVDLVSSQYNTKEISWFTKTIAKDV